MSERGEIVLNGESVASREVHTGYLSGPGFADAPVRYSVVNEIAIYDGCIEMGPADEVAAHAEQVQAARALQTPAGGAGPGTPGAQASSEAGGEAGGGVGGGPAGNGAPGGNGATAAQAAEPTPPAEVMGVGLPPTSSFLWTNGVVPFVVDDNLPNTARVTQAIDHIEANTGIRFVPRTNQANRIRFVRNPDAGWSSSAIGMRGGEQLIRLSDGATMGTTVHECLHALGVLHEQSRCDRDQFVTINYQNVQEGFESNFDRFCDGYRDYFDYDYGSIMHYGATAFTRNNQPTIVPAQSGVTIGQRTGMSVIDRLTVAEMYSRFTGRGHTGVWRAGSGRYGLWVNTTWDSFRSKWQEWAGQGLRLVDIHVRRVGNQNRYSGVWLPGTGRYGLWANANWDSFRAKWQEWSGQGLRLVDINVHRTGRDTRYSGVFLAGTDKYYLWANVPWESLRARWNQLGGQGLRLVDYEFTEPSAADFGDLDAAGTLATLPAAADVPEGTGGLFDDSGPVDLSHPELPGLTPVGDRPAAAALPTGEGGFEPATNGAAESVADADDAAGGLAPDYQEARPAPSGEPEGQPEGQGEAVLTEPATRKSA